MGSVSNPGCLASLDCLPDELLVQILSLLPTKQAASTSLLSRRWRTLFTLQHNLDFDDSIFSHPEDGKRDREDIQMSFRSFMYTTLASQCGNRVKKFSLKCEDVDDVVHVDRWICHAMEHGVSELYLSIKPDEKLSLISSSFKDVALSWYNEELTKDGFTNWREFKRRLVARYAEVQPSFLSKVRMKKEWTRQIPVVKLNPLHL